MEKIKVGATVKDIITGFTGVVMARAEYLTGCERYGILPKGLTAEGKIPDWEWIDENRLLTTEPGIIKLRDSAHFIEPGGDAQNPPEYLKKGAKRKWQ